MKRVQVIIACLILAALLTACGGRERADGDETIRLAYIAKDLEHYWFQQVVGGIRDKCLELGVECDAFDAHFDDETCMALVDQVIKDGYRGLMICATSQSLGPEIGERCAQAGIPVVTIDDSMVDQNGVPFSHVGMATRETGGIGGAALARLARERGFFEPGNEVRIIELTVPNLSVFRERLDGYEDALLANTPLTREDILLIDTKDGMYDNDMLALEEYFRDADTAGITHFIVCGVNDDSALSPMHFLKARGYDEDHIIACGLGGYELSVEEFESGNKSYISIMLQPDIEGAKAAEMLYNAIAESAPMATSLVLGGKLATCDNYLAYYNYNKLSE